MKYLYAHFLLPFHSPMCMCVWLYYTVYARVYAITLALLCWTCGFNNLVFASKNNFHRNWNQLALLPIATLTAHNNWNYVKRSFWLRQFKTERETTIVNLLFDFYFYFYFFRLLRKTWHFLCFSLSSFFSVTFNEHWQHQPR